MVDSQKIAVLAMALVTGGDMVWASSTELADQILNDLTSNLEKEFGFRYSSAQQSRIYQSGIIVEFESRLERKLEGLEKLQTILNREIPRPGFPFRVKRLAFGNGDVTLPLQFQPSLESMERADFTIERRTGVPYETNRYYCTGPVPTQRLAELMTLIEREL